MKALHNVDKSPFRKGEYVGYANGVWHIRRNYAGWIANHRENKHTGITGMTLSDISAQLDKIAKG